MYKTGVLDYLKEYESLCKKYNLTIDGCGCCGSPFIDNVKFDEDEIYEINEIKLENNKLMFNIKRKYSDCFFYKSNVDLEWLETFINNNFKNI